ncbi:MAG: dihydroxyacetone kinase subunit L [Kiritimatiellae bacterium]|nr:dihydroxyacetone kinase subunit L [Kiritimatiellia bacterium]
MLNGAVANIRTHHARLSELDAINGDGDHGTTMLRAAARMEGAIAEHKDRNLQALLSEIAWALLGVDGGAAGPLLGLLFSGLSQAADGAPALDAEGLARAFEAGLASVAGQTKARVGDKTMMDALIPAVSALRKGAETGQDCLQSLKCAAEAAGAGAEATKALTAKFGRAKNLGDRTLGYPDPGATSLALMFQGYWEGVQKTGAAEDASR